MPDAYYDKDYHTTRHAEMLESDEYFWARAETARLYFTPQECESRIFDYGCGVGQSMALLPNAEGWDISSEAIEACRARDLKVYENLADVPRQEYDIVFCRHVMEHVEEPLDALRTMREFVKPTGEVYLILPKEKHYSTSFEPDLNQHLYCWNFRTLNNLLVRAGFAPYHNSYRYPFGWMALLPIRKMFGRNFYLWCTKLGGVFRRNGELIVRARLQG